MSQSSWLAIDENGDETIHQYEPYYNQLHMKWDSTNKTYVTKGLFKTIVNYSMDSITKAVAVELLGNLNLSSKITPITIKRIYKG